MKLIRIISATCVLAAGSTAFGDAEPTSVFGDDFGATGTVVDATITVVPEPTSACLLGVGVLLGLLRRRRS